jgi:hypothetical protein
MINQNQFTEDLNHLIGTLENHPLYNEINSLKRLRFFMERHVYAVFDFMSLVKNLQQEIAPANSYWVPPKNNDLARFINEIVLSEESDITDDGRHMSHFEMYCHAMSEVKADADFPFHFARHFMMGELSNPDIPKPAREFMRHTFSTIEQGKLHQIAASFCFGREKCIPPMFKAFLEKMNIDEQSAPMFHFYLKRHIDLDGDSHGPLAMKMIAELCGNDESKWHEAKEAAKSSLKARIQFWDDVLAEIREV